MKAFLAVVAVIAWVFIAFRETTASMVDIWTRSDTFTHCFLVVPVVVWLVWQRRWNLAAAEARPSWAGVVAIAGSGALWLAGELASALAPTHWGMVLMVPAFVLALFGAAWLRVLAFPLAFLLFAVPFGEVFVPTLIDWTADFTVAALTATGIPVFREGTHFVIPSGRWSVVEACSGIRYLIASLFVGVLYAWMLYRSPVRRALFIAASILVPIVANWMRAYLIVMIGHLSGNKLAVGVDHLIYGWVFFGAVIALMFWIGARWREDEDDGAVGAASAALPSRPAHGDRPVLPKVSVVLAIAVLVAAWPFARDAVLAASADERPLQPVALTPAGGWVSTAAPAAAWEPHLAGAGQRHVMTFSRAGRTVSLFVAQYRNQAQGRELVNSMNRLVDDEAADHWVQVARGGREAGFGAAATSVRTATVQRGADRVRVWHWYWLDGRVETSDARGKLSLALDRLLLRSDTSAWVAVFTPAETDAEGDRALAEFLAAMGPALQASLAAAEQR